MKISNYMAKSLTEQVNWVFACLLLWTFVFMKCIVSNVGSELSELLLLSFETCM